GHIDPRPGGERGVPPVGRDPPGARPCAHRGSLRQRWRRRAGQRPGRHQHQPGPHHRLLGAGLDAALLDPAAGQRLGRPRLRLPGRAGGPLRRLRGVRPAGTHRARVRHPEPGHREPVRPQVRHLLLADHPRRRRLQRRPRAHPGRELELALLMRRLLSWLHLWVGLVAGTLFAVLGLSGSLLVFHEDLLRWQHPQLEGHVLEPDGEVLAAILARETPRGLRSIQFPDASMPTYIGFYVDGRRGYFAPEDGDLLLMRSTGDDFLLWLQDLHIHFLAGEAGEQVVGIVGWVALGLLLTGLYLWWPKRGKLKVSLTWFANPPVRRWLTWHRSTG